MKSAGLLCVLLCLTYVYGSRLNVEVPANQFQCFFQTVDREEYKTLEVNYQVISGGNLDINVMVLLGANVIQQVQKQTSGAIRIPITSLGEYQICFDNTFSYQTSKIVYFGVLFFTENGDLVDDLVSDQPVPEDVRLNLESIGVTLATFESSINRIKTNLNRAEYFQNVLRAFEARDRALMDNNNSKVWFWSCINSLLILVVGTCQVFVIRTLFQ